MEDGRWVIRPSSLISRPSMSFDKMAAGSGYGAQAEVDKFEGQRYTNGRCSVGSGLVARYFERFRVVLWPRA